jgi:hypothetical protein
MEDILNFIGYMLPACLVVAVVIFVLTWSIRATRKSLTRADECLQLNRDMVKLLEESVTLQRETNRLLAVHQGTQPLAQDDLSRQREN